ncbi:MAG: hypothetical protein Q7J28_01080 [Caulobacter sp.]|nr:hypothetical protein [Caulobacter sp.]
MLTMSQEEALERAQDIAFDAMEATTPAARLRLAKLALKESEFCADAWLILAESESSGSDAELGTLRRAVAGGESALGPQTFEDDVGLFWGLLETRPYMRARLALAQALWDRGYQLEAIDNARDLLRLNPNDNQGVRYLLASWLAAHGDAVGLRALIADYENDDSPFMTWPTVLSAFREQGGDEIARAALDAALASNKHVVGLLLGKKRLPSRRPAYYSPGEVSEAVIYVQDFKDTWHATEGALDWLRLTTTAA